MNFRKSSMVLTNRKLNIGFLLAVAGTFLTSISLIGNIQQTLTEKSIGVIAHPDDDDNLLEKLDDVTKLLLRNHEKVATIRQKLDRLSLKFNLSYVADEKKVQNVIFKRHLMDTIRRDQHAVVTSEAGRLTSVGGDGRAEVKGTVKSASDLIHKNYKISENSMFNCHDIASSSHVSYVGSGYTKTVDVVTINGTKVALKRPAMGGKDMTHCVESGTPRADCWTLSSYKVLKEIALLQQLHHPSVIKLLGFCTEETMNRLGRFSDVSLVTELGSPIDFLRLLQIPWEDRLRLAYDVTTLLVYLADSPMGPLIIHDFKPTQFVLIDGKIKLADLDDVDTSLPSCSPSNLCAVRLPEERFQYVPCNSAGLCPEYADRLNLHLAWTHFYSLQQYGGPTWLQDQLDVFLNKTRHAEISSKEALILLDQIVKTYKTGNFDVKNGTQAYSYNFTMDVDLPGRYDYWCTYTRTPQTNSCVFSAASEEEAQHICSLDDNCRAFVLTDEKTWTGRRLIYLKSGFSKPVESPGCKLFVRVS